MNILKRKHNVMVSLGATCFVRGYFDKHKYSQKSYVFDWVGSAMWGICDLIENNFENVLDQNNYKYMITAEKEKWMVVNKEYYLLFKHHFPEILADDPQKDVLQQKHLNDNTFAEFLKTFSKRVTEFKELLNDKKKILFVRQEQYMDTRIIYPEYKDKFEHSELHYLKKFTEILKTMYPALKFNVVLISHTLENQYIPENNIVIVKGRVTDWEECANFYNKIFDDNKRFLSTCSAKM